MTEHHSLEARVDELSDLVTAVVRETTSAQDATDAAIAELADAVDRLSSAGPRPAAGEPPRAWVDRATAEEWTQLCDWVDWLVGTYEVPTRAVPPCWPVHRGVAEELAAVWRAWRQAAQAAGGEDNDSLAFWHDRYLAPLLHRLTTMYRSKDCQEKHEEVLPPRSTDRSLVSLRPP